MVIGANYKIRPNCYLWGATTIGDNCHIGQSVEIKNPHPPFPRPPAFAKATAGRPVRLGQA